MTSKTTTSPAGKSAGKSVTTSPTARQVGWRTRVIAGFALAIAVLAAAGGWALFGPLTNAVMNQQTNSLLSLAWADTVALSEMVPTEPLTLPFEQEIQGIVDTLAVGGDTRVTVIAKDGTVIADSNEQASAMSNHGDRPEVQEALSQGKGSDRRVSSTENNEQIYAATRGTLSGGETVVVRTSQPVTEVVSGATSARNTGLLLLGIAFVVSLVVLWRTLSSAARPVERLETVRTDFVANASHELKTPVAGIRLLSETVNMAAQDGDYATVHSLVSAIDQEAEKLQYLISDLINLSRLEDEQPAIIETTDARSVLHAEIDAKRSLAVDKNLTIELVDEVPASDTCRMKISARDLRLALDNLLDNAIAYSERGSGPIKVKLHAGSDYIVIDVRDHGMGIPADEQERVFERFYRGDDARDRYASGTGLGLALVKHAIEHAGGSVKLKSSPGEGTKITLLVPRA